MKIVDKFTIVDSTGLKFTEILKLAVKECHSDVNYHEVRDNELKFRRLYTTGDGKIVYIFEVYGEIH